MITKIKIFFSLYFSAMQLSRTVEIEPKNQAAVRVGESLRIRCRMPTPLGHCRIEIPNEGSLVIGNTENYSNENVKYLGTGLDKGDCDILISRIKDSNDGIFKCSLLPKDSGYESTGTTRIVIASKCTIIFFQKLNINFQFLKLEIKK